MTEYFQGEKLSAKERAFVQFLVSDANFVVTEAARMAKYKAPNASGANLLTRQRVQLAIQKRLEEGTISRAETLHRLSEIASGAMQWFVKNGKIDLESKEAIAKRHLLKRVSQDTTYNYDKDGNVVSETSKTTIEVYDALSALTILAKYHGLLQVEALSNNITNNTLVVNDWRTQARQLNLDENEIAREANIILQEMQSAQAIAAQEAQPQNAPTASPVLLESHTEQTTIE